MNEIDFKLILLRIHMFDFFNRGPKQFFLLTVLNLIEKTATFVPISMS